MSNRYPGRPKIVKVYNKCKVTDCLKTSEGGSKGFCKPHYHSARKGIFDWNTGEQIRPLLRVRSYGEGALCDVEGCNRRPRVSGLCIAHSQRKLANKDLSLPIKLPRGPKPSTVLCLIDGCQKRANNRGMCSPHAEKRRNGLLSEDGQKLRETLSGGRKREREKWISSTRDGYILRVAPINHPNPRADGTILEHRLVMESMIGRYLTEWEIVHHKDGNRQNNTKENLELLDGRAHRGEGHPPGSEFDNNMAIQILLQQSDLPVNLRQQLELYRNIKTDQEVDTHQLKLVA